MTITDLKIQDRGGDALTLRAPGPGVTSPYGATLVANPESVDHYYSVGLRRRDARVMVTWLNLAFGLDLIPEIGQAAHSASLTVTVPGAAGGEPRVVEWYGDDIPEWLQRLAAIALSGSSAAHDVAYDLRELVRSVAELLRRAGFNPEGQGIESCVGELVSVNLATRNQLRDLLKSIGAETIASAQPIMQENRRQLDAVARALLSALGRTDMGEGFELAELVEEIKANHRAALASVQGLADARARRMASELGRKLETVTANAAAQAQAAEREPRAALQVELDRARLAGDVQAKRANTLQERLDATEEARRLTNVDLIDERMRRAELQEMLDANRVELAALREEYDEHERQIVAELAAQEARSEALQAGNDNLRAKLATARVALSEVRANFWDEGHERTVPVHFTSETSALVVAKIDRASTQLSH